MVDILDELEIAPEGTYNFAAGGPSH